MLRELGRRPQYLVLSTQYGGRVTSYTPRVSQYMLSPIDNGRRTMEN